MKHALFLFLGMFLVTNAFGIPSIPIQPVHEVSPVPLVFPSTALPVHEISPVPVTITIPSPLPVHEVSPVPLTFPSTTMPVHEVSPVPTQTVFVSNPAASPSPTITVTGSVVIASPIPSQTVTVSNFPTPSPTITVTGAVNATITAPSPLPVQEVSPIPTQTVTGIVTANAGSNLNTSLLALESGGHLAAIDTTTNSILANQTNASQKTQVTVSPNTTDTAMLGSVTSLTGATSFVSIPTNGASTVTFAVTGTFVGTLQTQMSYDGGTSWGVYSYYLPGQGFFAIVGPNLILYMNVSGFTHMRVKATAWTSGSANVTMNASSAQYLQQVHTELPTDFPNIPYGAVTTNAPTYTTGTNAQLSIDTAGGLRTSAGDGSIVTVGLKADAAATDSTSSWTAISILKGLWAKLNTINTTLGTPFQAGGLIGNTSFTANAGTNLNTSLLALDSTLTGGTQKAQVNDGTNTAKVTNASTAAAAADKALVVSQNPVGGNPCYNPNALLVSIAGVTSGTSATQIIALSGSTKIYVCSMSIIGVSGTTPTFSLVQGTASNCASGQTVFTQAFTSTAGQLFSFANPVGVGVAGNALCYKSTGTTPVQNYQITYVQQ